MRIPPGTTTLAELADRSRARDYYEKLIALWKDADPELQPILKDAKERVARLSGEH